jgi:hypothetical protein
LLDNFLDNTSLFSLLKNIFFFVSKEERKGIEVKKSIFKLKRNAKKINNQK